MASNLSVQSANQSAWQQFKVSQAERNADQAEQNARALRAEADAAQRSADRAQENARTLGVDADQAQQSAGRARQGVAASRTEVQAGTRLSAAVDKVVQAQVQAQAPAPAQPKEPVVNSLGQVTGQVVSVSA